ncbi:MAG: hypothetical protein HFE04_00055 [Bacilli bacterium]|nr:hypothetical protein [Bacilli bacterium]
MQEAINQRKQKIEFQYGKNYWRVTSSDLLYLYSTNIGKPNKENLEQHLDALKYLLTQMNSKQYTKEDKKQIMKMIYNYLCLEVLYERKRKSILLANITLFKNLEELKEYITQELKNELKEIKTSTYGNLELIKYLDMLINLKGTILDEEVIRTIMKCTKPELVQRINQELISNRLQSIQTNQLEKNT